MKEERNSKNILVLGSGAREDALAWKLRQSPLCRNLFIAPGNGSEREGITRVAVHLGDAAQVARLCLDKEIDLLVVGPEQPLVDGLVDFLQEQPELKQMCIVGPTAKGAVLEGSKDFAKAFMQKHGIPTAKHFTVTPDTIEDGYAFLEELQAPYVLKADGLAAGKGVLILDDLASAKEELKAMLSGKFGNAGARVVLEEHLTGIECSCFVLTDGQHYRLLPLAKDYKRVGEADTGLNTGGMGAVSPLPFLTDKLLQRIEEKVVRPSIRGIHSDRLGYKGFLFIGLMISQQGEPYVIEYNCRMGDPETEVVLPRIAEDMVPHLLALKDETLSSGSFETVSQAAATVILCSGGYPSSYQSHYKITGVSEAEALEGVTIFHAGTRRSEAPEDKESGLFSAGGRVMACTALAEHLEDALQKSYEAVAKISFQDAFCRKDIGQDVLNLTS